MIQGIKNILIYFMRFIVSTLFIFFLVGCTSHKSISTIYTTNDWNQKFQPISFKALADSAFIYDGHFVEISGYYYWGTEVSAISRQKGEHEIENMIWVDLDPDLATIKGNDTVFLFRPLKEYDKIKRKRIKIRGKIDSSNHGHGWVAYINFVCYVELLD